jgi:hypothetical protein
VVAADDEPKSVSREEPVAAAAEDDEPKSVAREEPVAAAADAGGEKASE